MCRNEACVVAAGGGEGWVWGSEYCCWWGAEVSVADRGRTGWQGVVIEFFGKSIVLVFDV